MLCLHHTRRSVSLGAPIGTRGRWRLGQTYMARLTDHAGGVSAPRVFVQGKSGMLFFSTRDKRFIVKTLKTEELRYAPRRRFGLFRPLCATPRPR